MDREELTEFVKIFKEVTDQQQQQQKEDDIVDCELKKKKKNKKNCCWFDTFEDRFFTLLILLISLLYLFLLVTNQTALLRSEYNKFQNSKLIIDHHLLSLFYTQQELQVASVKIERIRYDQYVAKKEFQLDWNSISQQEINLLNCDSHLKETVNSIDKQHKIIKDLLLKSSAAPHTNKSTAETVIPDFLIGDFSHFKNIYVPIEIDHSVDNISSIKNRLDTLYSQQIRNHFKTLLKHVQLRLFKPDDSVLFSSKQEILFLQQLIKLKPADSTLFDENLKTLLSSKERAVREYEEKIVKAVHDLKTTIESVPICPKIEIDNIPEQAENAIHDHYLIFFNKLYSNK